MKYEGWKIGPRIQSLRKMKGMTAEALSAELGASVSHVSQIEQGNRKMSIDLLYKMMDVLEVDANTFLGISKVEGSFVSIDEELMNMPIEEQNYLRDVFVQMIRKFPA